jgi:hypothetical protein
MKKSLMLSLLLLTVVSCGKKNIITSNAPVVNSHNNALATKTVTPTNLTTARFIGNYDLVEQAQPRCGASLQIIKGCDGIKLLTNHREEEEHFCDINKGELDDMNTTLLGNQIKQTSFSKVIERHQEERKHSHDNNEIRQQSITHTLTLSPEGVLEEEITTKGQTERCVYFKR